MKYIVIALLFASCVRNQPVKSENLPESPKTSQIVKFEDTSILRAPVINVDSLLRANDSLAVVADTLAKRLLYSRLVISNVRYYVNICNRNPSQDKFLRGWINRAIK